MRDGRVEKAGFGGAAQLIRQRLRLFRNDVETKDLDGHEPIARRLVRPEDRTERPHSHLMQHAERAERGRRGECCGVLSGQRVSSWEQIMKL